MCVQGETKRVLTIVGEKPRGSKGASPDAIGVPVALRGLKTGRHEPHEGRSLSTGSAGGRDRPGEALN